MDPVNDAFRQFFWMLCILGGTGLLMLLVAIAGRIASEALIWVLNLLRWNRGDEPLPRNKK